MKVIKSIFVIQIIILLASCVPTKELEEKEKYIEERESYIEQREMYIKEIEKELKQVSERNAFLENKINKVKEQNRDIINSDYEMNRNLESIIGEWSPNWPVGEGGRTSYTFHDDNTFNFYQTWSSLSKDIELPMKNFYGSNGEWKLIGNKIYLRIDLNIYSIIKEIEKIPAGYFPKDKTFIIEDVESPEWELVADIRSFRMKWARSEDWQGYSYGEEYPIGDPDVKTLFFKIINNGELKDDFYYFVYFGKESKTLKFNKEHINYIRSNIE
ncbi:MAG: hypothetical protein JEZ05_11070 [Tenericutes bacterium]|nr:hypothetical protein [Mycoplasmatota bacterium]